MKISNTRQQKAEKILTDT